jgi:hypothetical protein
MTTETPTTAVPWSGVIINRNADKTVEYMLNDSSHQRMAISTLVRHYDGYPDSIMDEADALSKVSRSMCDAVEASESQGDYNKAMVNIAGSTPPTKFSMAVDIHRSLYSVALEFAHQDVRPFATAHKTAMVVIANA